MFSAKLLQLKEYSIVQETSKWPVEQLHHPFYRTNPLLCKEQVYDEQEALTGSGVEAEEAQLMGPEGEGRHLVAARIDEPSNSANETNPQLSTTLAHRMNNGRRAYLRSTKKDGSRQTMSSSSSFSSRFLGLPESAIVVPRTSRRRRHRDYCSGGRRGVTPNLNPPAGLGRWILSGPM